MNKILKYILLAVVLPTGLAVAAETTIQPSDKDMYDLDHWWYYTWGIEVDVDQPITSASIKFNNIRNWNDGENYLYIHLLDGQGIPLGLTSYTDINDAFEDAFEGQGELLAVWSDTIPGGTKEDVTFVFTEEQIEVLNAYAADGFIALGFDPDCHYYNDGVSFSYTTVVPAPGAVSLSAMGIVIIGWLRNRKTV